MLPSDPVMLLSVLNTNLRDYDSSLEEMCQRLQIKQSEIEKKMEEIGYCYDKDVNQFR